jgi:hypothetical protein
MSEFDTNVTASRADQREQPRRRAPSPVHRFTVGSTHDRAEAEADEIARLVTSAVDARTGRPTGPSPASRIRRSPAGATAVVRRRVQKDPSWTTGPVGSVTGGGWLSWSQQQIDEKFTAVEQAHHQLEQRIAAAEGQGAELADASPGAQGLGAAKATYDAWNRPITWKEGEQALKDINVALAKLDGVSERYAAQQSKERNAWADALGRPLAGALLDGRYTLEQLKDLDGRLGQGVLAELGRGVGIKRINDLMELLPTEAAIETLAPFGGSYLLELKRDIPNLPQIAKGCTHAEVEAVLDTVSRSAANKLGTYRNAKRMMAEVITPLEAELVELVAARLESEQIEDLFKTLTVARVKVMAGTKQDNRVAKLYEHRARLKSLQVKLKPADKIVGYWNSMQTRWLEKLWAGKDDADVAKVLTEVGVDALNSLLPTMEQAKLYDLSTRLSNKGLKGFGEAMPGKDLTAVTAPAGGAGPATPSDALLKDLGSNHGATLKAAAKLLGSGIDTVVRRCAATPLDASKTASFLSKAVTYGWKNSASLASFFDKAGANVEARVALFEDFGNDGNRGTSPDVDGESGPATAVHECVIDGVTWKVAEGDVNHYMSGHVYATYAMTLANVQRGTSSMWPTGTTRATVEQDAGTVLGSARFEALARAAGNDYEAGAAGAFRAGAQGKLHRMTMFHPNPGTQLSIPWMEAVYYLFKSRT